MSESQFLNLTIFDHNTVPYIDLVPRTIYVFPRGSVLGGVKLIFDAALKQKGRIDTGAGH